MACVQKPQPPLLTVAGQRWTYTKLSPLPPVAAPHWNRLREYTIFRLVPRECDDLLQGAPGLGSQNLLRRQGESRESGGLNEVFPLIFRQVIELSLF